MHIPAVNQFAGKHLQQRIGPEETTEEDAELIRAEMQIPFDAFCRNAEVSTIYVVDSDRQNKEAQCHPVQSVRAQGL